MLPPYDREKVKFGFSMELGQDYFSHAGFLNAFSEICEIFVLIYLIHHSLLCHVANKRLRRPYCA